MFFKRKIILNCYTNQSDVYNYFPIVETKKKFPKWLRKTKASYFKSIEDRFEGVKSCPAFVDYFLTGFVLPIWSDLGLTVGKEGSNAYRWQFSDRRSEIEFHSFAQFALDEKSHQHFKLVSPWAFSCSEDIKFLWSAPSWRFGDLPETLEILNGVLNFRTNTGTNINMLVKRTEKEQQFLLEAGTPLVHLIPLTDKKIVLKVHLVNTETMRSILNVGRRATFFIKTKKKIQHAFKGKFKTLA